MNLTEWMPKFFPPRKGEGAEPEHPSALPTFVIVMVLGSLFRISKVGLPMTILGCLLGFVLCYIVFERWHPRAAELPPLFCIGPKRPPRQG